MLRGREGKAEKNRREITLSRDGCMQPSERGRHHGYMGQAIYRGAPKRKREVPRCHWEAPCN